MADYDVTVVGGGPSGLTAALYASRGGLKTILLEKMTPGGLAQTTDIIENYPGFPEGVSGPELMVLMEEQAGRFGAEFKTIVEVTEIENLNGDQFSVVTSNESFSSKSVIIASGAEPKKLGIPGEGEYTGRGVSYCAVCDGAFFKDAEVAVIGGGNSATEEALFLTKFAKKVKLIHRRDRLRADKINADRAEKNPKIEIIWDTVLEKIVGGDKGVSAIRLKNIKKGEETELAIEGVFIYVGYRPNTEFVKDLVRLDEYGFIITDGEMNTSVPGIMACGDVRSKALRQIVTAAGEGATAAFAAEKYIEKLEKREYEEFKG
ncbi:MAG: thioredoxin-disulfide reductase [Deltaproteobacteria bacterium]|uniref:Thioredoxin reductase n=1 Tax=Candidatus Zymogenus saltonus TaxID=2844893 RepID=A0A9D8KEH0_9DELT|nr:thioredoxin-disulfide reductase [Candidatus Zymogenus saltonus]